MSILSSFVFVIGYLILLGSVLAIPKSNKALSGIAWLSIGIVGMMCFHTLIAGIIHICCIPVNILSLGIIDVTIGGLLWYKIKKQKQIQKYEWKKIDIIFLLVLFVVLLRFTFIHFTSDLLLNYRSVDPAIHLKNALAVVTNESIFGMFYAPLNNALLMETLAPVFKFSSYYKIFVLSDVLNLMLSGIIFYSAVRIYCKDKFTEIVALVLPFLYLIGYQGNSTMFGFVYLGMGVTIVAYLIIITDMFLEDEIPTWLNIVLLGIGCYGLFECYVLFMPVVFISILVAILIKQWKKKKLFSTETVMLGLSIFLIPCMLGLFYIFSGVFTGGTTVNSAIAVEGGIYKDLYSNFIPYIPFALYGYCCEFRKKQNLLMKFLFPMWTMFMLILLTLGMYEKVSSYYFYKTYYVMWLLVLWLCFYGISNISVREHLLVVIVAAMQFAMMGNYRFNIEQRITMKNEMFNPSPKAVAYNDLLNFQWQVLRMETYPKEKIKLYQYVYDHLIEEKGESNIMCAADIEDYLWYHTITAQEDTGSGYWSIGEEQYWINLENNNTNYVMVLYDCPLYKAHKDYFDEMDVLYHTEKGFIGKWEKN